MKTSDHIPKTTRFDFLLNSLELAGKQSTPANHDYAGKRQAVISYVRNLELLAYAAARLEWPESEADFDVVSILAQGAERATQGDSEGGK